MSRITQTMQSGMLTLVALALVALPALVVTPHVYADEDDTVTTTQSDDTGTEIETEDSDDDGLEDRVQDRTREVRAAASRNVERLREKSEDRAERTEQRRMRLCETRQTSIQNKLGAFKGAGERQLSKLDGAYDKLTAYQTDRSLTVDGYADLTAAADAAQTAATADVLVMTGLIEEGFDCESENVADQLSSVKEAGLKARESLRSYRAALHDILVSLLKANAQTTSDDDTTETTETETTEGDA